MLTLKTTVILMRLVTHWLTVTLMLILMLTVKAMVKLKRKD
jgi:hypothetical protein